MKAPGIFIKCFLCIGIASFLSACKVGPDYHAPTSPNVNQYTSKKIHSANAGDTEKTQYFILGEDIPAQWWTLYHSKELNQLIEKGLKNSPTLIAAEAALKQSEELVTAQIGSSLYPNVSLQASGQRQRFSDATIGGTGGGSSVFNLYNVTIPVTYTLDLFGGARRQIESLMAQSEYQRYQLRAAHLTLTSNIVTAVITSASLAAQMKATQQLIRQQEEQLVIVKRQFQLGGVSQSDVLAQESQLAQTKATLPPLATQLAKSQDALAVLVGDLPGNSALPIVNLNQLHLPQKIPLSLPSTLVKRRPDVAASEALLHSASAQVGVAVANLFPQISLGPSASYGWTGAQTNQLFRSTFAAWTYGAQLAQPIFNGGSLRAKKRAAVAAFEQAGAQYRQTVLTAFQNVADTLQALQYDAKTVREQKAAERAAFKTLQITQKQFELGGVSYISLLNAQKTYQQAKINFIQAQALRYSDTAGLFQALGGGWQ